MSTNQPAKKSNSIAALLSIAVVVVGIWFFLGGGVENKVATDAEQQYELALKSHDRTDICVHAGLVAAAYQQANNEEKYLHWKDVEKSDCAYLGRP